LRAALPEVTQNMTSSSSHDPDLNAYMLYRRGVDESRKPITQSTAASALGWFDAALEIDPEYAAAFAGKCAVLTAIYRINSDPESVRLAESACSTALELNPNLDMVHTALGDLYALTGQYTESEVAYLQALRINPKSVRSLTGLADIYRLQSRPEEAEATLQSAIGLQPGNWGPYNSLGYFFFRQGRFDEAAEQFGHVVSIDKRNIRGISNMAASYMMAGNFEEAAPAFQQAIAIEPQTVNYSNLGIMYYYLGRYDEAAAAIREAIKLTPNDYLPWSNLGDILFVNGKASEARAAFATAKDLIDAALDVNPNDPGTLTDLAWIQAMLGDNQQALQNIKKASSALADDPYVYYIRGLINKRFGNTEEALDDFEAAVAKGYSKTILKAEPHLTELRNNPRFEKIVATN
jgi:tetratricopeptide (TPR) repeat protein